MRQRLGVYMIAVVTVAAMAVGPSASAQGASPSIVPVALWAADLHGATAYPRVRGDAEVVLSGSNRSINVRIWHAARLAGRRLLVYSGGLLAGHMRVGSKGRAHFSRDTAKGQYVPPLRPDHRWIKVRTRRGVLVASGRLRLVNAP